jgi:hypothetical protein
MRSFTLKSKVVLVAKRFKFYVGGSSAMKNIRGHIVRSSLVLCAGLLGLVSPAAAVNIAWISFHAADNMPSAAAVTAGFTEAPDKGYTDLLTTAGHTVTRIVGSNAPNVAQLNTFDLVMISRSVDSSWFSPGNPSAAWASVTKPMIHLGGYAIRGGTGGGARSGFTTGETIPDVPATPTSVNLTVNAPAHPIFAGVAVSGGVMTQPYANIVTAPVAGAPAVERGISVNTNSLAGNGVLLASLPSLVTATPPGQVGMVIGEFPRGAVMGNAPGDVQLGNRLVFLTGSRESGTAPTNTSNAAGIFDLTTTGSQMLRQAVTYIAAAPAPVIGDVNGNGVADINDYALIRDNFNKAGNKGQGDLTGDGQVNFRDFRMWKNFRSDAGVGSDIDLLAGLGIPEPGSVVLAMLAAISLAGMVARRGRR